MLFYRFYTKFSDSFCSGVKKELFKVLQNCITENSNLINFLFASVRIISYILPVQNAVAFMTFSLITM